MRKIILYSILHLMLFGLMGCGFHLRGTDTHVGQALPHLHVTPNDPYDPFMQSVTLALKRSGVTLNEQKPNIATLHIEPQHITSQPLAYGPSGELHRERIEFTLTYRFKPENQKQSKTHTQTIRVTRDRQLNLRQDLGDWAEKQTIVNEMQKDAIDQLLRQLTILCN